jgi:hypothetical protein
MVSQLVFSNGGGDSSHDVDGPFVTFNDSIY